MSLVSLLDVAPASQQPAILSPAQGGFSSLLGGGGSVGGVMPSTPAGAVADLIRRDPEFMGRIRADLLSGVKLDMGAIASHLRAGGIFSAMQDGEITELERRLARIRRGSDPAGAALAADYIGKGGLVDVALGKGVISGAGGKVTWTLSSLGGASELYDCRFYIQDEKEVVAYIETIKVGTKDHWSIAAATGASTSQSPFVTSVGRWRNTHPDFRPGDGFRLGKLNVSNNNALVIVAPGYGAIATTDEVYGWISCRPKGGDIGETGCAI